jgi:serine protease
MIPSSSSSFPGGVVLWWVLLCCRLLVQQHPWTIPVDAQEQSRYLHSTKKRLDTAHEAKFLGGRRQPDEDDDDLIRLQVSYKSSWGETIAKACAHQIIDNPQDNNEIVMTAKESCLQSLKDDPDILHAEVDVPTEAMRLYGTSTSSIFTSSNRRLFNWKDPIPEIPKVPKEPEPIPVRNNTEVMPYGMKMIQADTMEMGNQQEVTICIADTGISMDHPDLNTEFVTGEDTVLSWGEVWKWDDDRVGHGTSVAGIIAAARNNGIGTAGVAGTIRLYIVRALDDEGVGHDYDTRRAIEKCVNAGAKIINLALGSTYMSQLTDELIRHAVDDLGVLIIAAAGNSGSDENFYPAAHQKVISVGGVMEDGLHWQRSTYGDQIEFVAPAHKVLSTTVSTSSIRTESISRSASYLDGSKHTPVIGPLVDCENGSSRCRRVRDGICLLCLESEDPSALEDMLKKCERSKAKGAIIFKGQGTDNFSWAQHTSLTAVVVQRSVGEELKDVAGKDIYIGDSGDDGIEYTYMESTGTSMSVPHISAAAALVWSNVGVDCTGRHVRYALAKKAYHPTAESNRGRGCDEIYGHGIVKAEDAYNYLSKKDCSKLEIPVSEGGCSTTTENRV